MSSSLELHRGRPYFTSKPRNTAFPATKCQQDDPTVSSHSPGSPTWHYLQKERDDVRGGRAQRRYGCQLIVTEVPVRTTRRQESFKSFTLHTREMGVNQKQTNKNNKKQNSAELAWGRLLLCSAEHKMKHLKASFEWQRRSGRPQKLITDHTQSLGINTRMPPGFQKLPIYSLKIDSQTRSSENQPRGRTQTNSAQTHQSESSCGLQVSKGLEQESPPLPGCFSHVRDMALPSQRASPWDAMPETPSHLRGSRGLGHVGQLFH